MEFKISMKKIAQSLIILFFITLSVNIYATEKMPLPRPDNLHEIKKIQKPSEIGGEIGLEFINYYIINNCLTSSTYLI